MNLSEGIRLFLIGAFIVGELTPDFYFRHDGVCNAVYFNFVVFLFPWGFGDFPGNPPGAGSENIR
jgi:hypothetical protein